MCFKIKPNEEGQQTADNFFHADLSQNATRLKYNGECFESAWTGQYDSEIKIILKLSSSEKIDQTFYKWQLFYKGNLTVTLHK